MLADLAGLREQGCSIDREKTATGIGGFASPCGTTLRRSTPSAAPCRSPPQRGARTTCRRRHAGRADEDRGAAVTSLGGA
ncbi:hypothetical protein [Streptomyces sp. NBC_00401]|uniref:hypothetical protein n=1 Tax=unclassified Streptomyces TaxID=2593676 RepID=UPI002B1DB93E|nr:hypothetical protein [Streptomyces sp. NBC_00401]